MFKLLDIRVFAAVAHVIITIIFFWGMRYVQCGL